MGHKVLVPDAKALAYAIGWARRRWGEQGWAWHPAHEARGGMSWCCLGVREGDNEGRWVVKGIGATWGEAYADAEIREDSCS